MHSEATTLPRGGRLTPPLPYGGIDIRGKTWPHMARWAVRVQLVRSAYVHDWVGYAADADEARDRAMADAAQHWPGWSRCLRQVERLS